MRIHQVDPTRTLTLRNRFVSDMRRRFKALVQVVKESVDTNDCFGLRNETPTLFAQAAAQPNQFAFPRSADKVEAFMAWLAEQNEEYILSGGRRGIETLTGPGRITGADAWTSTYISSGYQQGIKRGRQELRRAGVDIPDFGDGLQDETAVAFNQPFHVDKVGLLYTRTFSDLTGITKAMETQIARVLAQGLADGRNPRELALLLQRTITGSGGTLSVTDTLGRFVPAQRRAEMLARTEIIRAHHLATINEYRAAGVLGVRIKAEFSTAGDGRVCVICQGYEFDSKIKPMTLDEVESLIPVHPNCRCIAIPHIWSIAARPER